MMTDTPDEGEEDNGVVEMPPYLGLKEKVGTSSHIAELLPYEKIEESQSVLSESQEDFLSWVKKDLLMLTAAAIRLETQPDALKEIRRVAFSLKSRAGTFGYLLASHVAKSLFDFCEQRYSTGNAAHLLAIRKHVDTLDVIFRQRIEGTGGEVGEALIQALVKLVQKTA